MLPVLIPLLTAVVGAVLSAALAQYYRRARPVVIIDEISRSPDVTPGETIAPVNQDLAAAGESWLDFGVKPLEADKPTLSEVAYVSQLKAILSGVEGVIEGLPAITKSAEGLDGFLQRGEHAEFEALFSVEINTLWKLLLGAHRKGEFEYSGTPPAPLSEMSEEREGGTRETPRLTAYPGTTSEYNRDIGTSVIRHPAWTKQIVYDSEGDFLIPLPGSRNLYLPWSLVTVSQRPKAFAFSMRTAIAFASFHKEDLQELTNYLLKVERQNRVPLEAFRAQLENELRLYDRIVVKGNIANRGGSPVTVTTDGCLFVALAGYSSSSDKRTLKLHPANEEIEMAIGSDRPGEEPGFESSMTIPEGSVTRFISTSVSRIHSLENAEVLQGLMTSGERSCYLGAMIVSPRRGLFRSVQPDSQFSPTYTDPRPFRDSAVGTRVPPRPESGWSKFLLALRQRGNA
ncbi:MAG TPA: hypothetical protein VK889_04840 [Solirubrobacterales bacterium]|nr:hypothetical protein [Solirubrobacterales bacterium]